MMSRAILSDLDITDRRIRVSVIGRDIYADNRAFIEAVQKIFPDKAAVLAKSAADHAYESFGYRTLWVRLPLVPAKLVSKKMRDDGAELFSVFTRPDYESLRPSALAEFRQLLDIVENDFLDQDPWIGGPKSSIADIHASWMIKMVLQTMEVEKEPGFSRPKLPKVHTWINGLPKHDEDNAPPKISAAEPKEKILGADYAAEDVGINANDPTGLKAGTMVTVETTDE